MTEWLNAGRRSGREEWGEKAGAMQGRRQRREPGGLRTERGGETAAAHDFVRHEVLGLAEVLDQHQVIRRGIELGIRQPLFVGRDADV